MSNEERFEKWWPTRANGYWDRVNAEKAARAAWHAAALSDEDRETCIEALSAEEYDAKERIERYRDVLYSGYVRGVHDHERFAAVRRRLEGADDER